VACNQVVIWLDSCQVAGGECICSHPEFANQFPAVATHSSTGGCGACALCSKCYFLSMTVSDYSCPPAFGWAATCSTATCAGGAGGYMHTAFDQIYTTGTVSVSISQ
jgi:hypothetical protein